MNTEMKMLQKKIALVLFVACCLTACNKPDVTYELSMTWVGNEDFSPVELQEQMDVNIRIKADAGIKEFVVNVDSDVLEPGLALIGITDPAMDLINDETVTDVLDNVTGGELPTGDRLWNQKEVDFNLSSLLPLILALEPENGTDHIFTISVKDGENQFLEKTCTFHYTGTSSITVSEIDLWLNTAVVNVELTSDVTAPTLAYRVKGAEEWNICTTFSEGTFTIAPEWEESVNSAEINLYSLKGNTGLFAGNVYELELRNGEEVIASAEYSTAEGDVIPNGDMSGWSFKTMTMSDTDYKITYPNQEGESFWDSGNNMFLEQYDESGNPKTFTPLCMEDEGSAMLSARLVLGAVFAPGNMYTGDFNYSGLSGTASFGKKYDWSARPKSLKVSYKGSVGVVDKVGSYDPEAEEWKDKQDVSRIYAVVIDWTAQHPVTSGMVEPTGMWDPSISNSVEEGAIIGYASLDIVASQDDFTTVEIPFYWYDTEAKPADGNYSLVISCATSNRGDYLTGCSTNVLYVDNFEWGY